MKICSSAADVTVWSRCYRRAGLSVGFVPTLGALHDGHAALIRQARRECERVIVSVYLNPTQFHSSGDLTGYPKDAAADLEACKTAGVDLVLLGEPSDFLPAGFQSWVEVSELTRPLCGAFRPGHFRGVTTVVTQLLHVVRPHRVYFGLKDYQQAKVIERMTGDLRFDVDVRFVATVRAPDGLAVSSRNVRLSGPERQAAVALPRALEAARELIASGEDRIDAVVRHVRAALEKEPLLRAEYIEVVDARTLEVPSDGRIRSGDAGRVLAVALHVGEVRLIDNIWLGPDAIPTDSGRGAAYS